MISNNIETCHRSRSKSFAREEILEWVAKLEKNICINNSKNITCLFMVKERYTRHTNSESKYVN